MNLNDFPEIQIESSEKLHAYWSYLQSKRGNVDEAQLGASDIATIYTAPLREEE